MAPRESRRHAARIAYDFVRTSMTTASGAPTSGASNANFQKLRPVCVNLLRLINKAPDDNALEDALAQLHVCLEVVDTLTPSLVHLSLIHI